MRTQATDGNVKARDGNARTQAADGNVTRDDAPLTVLPGDDRAQPDDMTATFGIQAEPHHPPLAVDKKVLD